jgi:anti-sigma factor RsiW
MTLEHDRFRVHAYVDGELTADEVADFERRMNAEPAMMAEVAALRAQKSALHARYDALMTSVPRARSAHSLFQRRGWATHVPRGMALAATVVVSVAVGIAAGWVFRGRADVGVVARAELPVAGVAVASRDAEGRLQSFVQTAALSHAVFVPEVRHPVEVAAADEAHLVAWLSKRLATPLVVPHLGDAGWTLLGGRLLPADSGPVAQFMYQDAGGRRLTLAVSRGAGTSSPDAAAASPTTAFRIAEEHGDTVFYWIDHDEAYALTGKLSRSEMTALATRVYRQLDKDGDPAATAPKR